MPLLNARPADVDIVVVFNPCSGSFIRSLALPNAFRVQRLRQYFPLGRGDDTLETATTTFTFDDAHRSHADAYEAFHAWGYQCGVVAVGPYEAVQGYELGEIDAHPYQLMGDGSFSLAASRAILTTRRVRGARLGADANLCAFARWHDPLEDVNDPEAPSAGGTYRVGDWTITAGGDAPFQTENGLLTSGGSTLTLGDIYLPAAGSTVELTAETNYGGAPTLTLRAERHTGEVIEEVSGAGPQEMVLPIGTFKLSVTIASAPGAATSFKEPRLAVTLVGGTSDVSLRRVAACMAYGAVEENDPPYWSPACGSEQDVIIVLEANDAPAWEAGEDVIELQFGENLSPTLVADPSLVLQHTLLAPQGSYPTIYAPPVFGLAGTTAGADYRAIDENGDAITSIDIEGATLPIIATQAYYNAGSGAAPTWVRDDSYATASSDRMLRVTWDAAAVGTDSFTVGATDTAGSTHSVFSSVTIR